MPPELPHPLRPRRSLLYMPGSNARALAKARSLAADGLIFDLEDAVAPAAKVAARDTIAAALAAGGYGPREILLRVNAPETPWGAEDLAFAARQPIDGVVLPKVDGGETVRQAVSRLRDHGAPRRLAVWCMMETPRGILDAAAIAGSSPALAGLLMGTADLAKELGARHTCERLPLLAALGLCLLAARAHGLAILDGVHLDLADEAGFARACRQGVEFGFDGKTLIHPKTIAAANAAFAPTAEDVAGAHRIIAAHDAAEARGEGVVLVDGRLVERLHVASARRLVALAGAIAAREAADGRG